MLDRKKIVPGGVYGPGGVKMGEISPGWPSLENSSQDVGKNRWRQGWKHVLPGIIYGQGGVTPSDLFQEYYPHPLPPGQTEIMWIVVLVIASAWVAATSQEVVTPGKKIRRNLPIQNLVCL